MPDDADEMLPSQVAAKLSVSHSTVVRWEPAFVLVPSRVLPSGYRRYRKSDVDELGRALALPRGPERDAALEAIRNRNRSAAAGEPAAS
jgi:DNA-binding transcriptional MerR regulator